MSSQISQATRPVKRRRWYQFSLRALIVSTVLLSVLLGIFTARLQRARRQAAAVELIRKSGGSVFYDYDRKAEQSPLPRWLIDAFGEDFFHDVTSVNLVFRVPDRKTRYAAYDALARLPQVDTLAILDGAKEGPHRFDVLRRLRRLEYLEIESPSFRGTDLQAIEGLPRLAHVWVPASLGEEGIRSVATLPELWCLELGDGHIDDQTFMKLTELTRLEFLGIRGADVSDGAIRKFMRHRPDVEMGLQNRDWSTILEGQPPAPEPSHDL